MTENCCTHGNGTSSTDDDDNNNNNNNNNRTLIFAYGTLKQGLPNNPLMQDLIVKTDAVYLGAYTTIDKLPLVCGPYGVPFLLNLPGSGHRVIGELYAVSEAGLARLDELEGTSIGHYERLPIVVVHNADDDDGDGGSVKVEAYYANRSYAEEMWKRNGERGIQSYTLEEAKSYVRRENRMKDRSFLDEIRSFLSCSPR